MPGRAIGAPPVRGEVNCRANGVSRAVCRPPKAVRAAQLEEQLLEKVLRHVGTQREPGKQSMQLLAIRLKNTEQVVRQGTHRAFCWGLPSIDGNGPPRATPRQP